MTWTQKQIKVMDLADKFAPKKGLFKLPENIIYLDGNSLGAMPRSTQARVESVLKNEWSQGLVRSWNKYGWINLPQKIGDKIANLIGAECGEVVSADSTSINVFKVVTAALQMQKGRNKIISEKGNFPTDLYILQGIENLMVDGAKLVALDRDKIYDSIDAETAVVHLTHVHYKTGALFDMDAITKKAHDVGALVVWDLAHTVGAMPIDLNRAGADFAVGCGYKYLNGGPGAPAFLFVAKRHQENVRPSLSGWMGHEKPFDFSDYYQPARGINRNLCGTPSVIALSAFEEGLNTFDGVDMNDIRDKSMALGSLFLELVMDQCGEFGFDLASPKKAERRGSHISLTHDHGFKIMQALIDHGVIGDFRAPNIVRFGFTPLYTSFQNIWDAVEILANIMDKGLWKDPKYAMRSKVT